MEFDPYQSFKILFAVLLIPGLLFLFILVIYIAFIGNRRTRLEPLKPACLGCGHTLLPHEITCSKCGRAVESTTEVPPTVEPH